MVPLRINFPVFFLISLKIACKNVVLPLATLPTTATNYPGEIDNYLISKEFPISGFFSSLS